MQRSGSCFKENGASLLQKRRKFDKLRFRAPLEKKNDMGELTKE